VKQKIRLSKCCIGEEEKIAVQGVLDREFLGMGEEVGHFERELTRFFNRPTVCVVNGTAALHLALQGCDFPPGSEVLVPSLTYLASYQAILAAGLSPVSCDIDERSFTLDIDDASKRLSKKTKAIMPVHYCGNVCDLSSIFSFSKNNNLRVIEDAAHAFGSTLEGRKVGESGDITCFSFDGIKNITAGEGGCVVSDDIDLIHRVSDARLLGVVNDSAARITNRRQWTFDVTAIGWRYHMSNIMAAIGIEQLKKQKSLASRRQALASKYDILFSSLDRISPVARNCPGAVPHIYVVRIADLTVSGREKLRKKMLAAGIETGIHYWPNHLLSFFQTSCSDILPITERVYPELLTVPLHPDLTEADLERVAAGLANFI
jgi:dTDP-4-amino-4,6-dideoxygalactose transaminase